MKYKHKLTGEILTIKKKYGLIVSCISENEAIISEKPFLSTNIVICCIENLEKIN